MIGRDHVLLEMFKTISKVSSKNKLHWILTSNAKIKYMGHSLDIDKANEQLEQNLFIIMINMFS